MSQVESWGGGFFYYNTDTDQIIELTYPIKIAVKGAYGDLLTRISKGEDKDLALIAKLTEASIIGGPIRPSAQLERGLILEMHVGNIAFCWLRFSPPNYYMNQVITYGYLGGPQNWLYGDFWRPLKPKVYDRLTGELVDRENIDRAVFSRYREVITSEEVERWQANWRLLFDKLDEASRNAIEIQKNPKPYLEVLKLVLKRDWERARKMVEEQKLVIPSDTLRFLFYFF